MAKTNVIDEGSADWLEGLVWTSKGKDKDAAKAAKATLERIRSKSPTSDLVKRLDRIENPPDEDDS